MKSTHKIRIQRFQDGKTESLHDVVTVEEPLEIRLVYQDDHRLIEKSISVTMRTPANDFELVVGFCYSEGILQKPEQIKSIGYCCTSGKDRQKSNIVRIQLQSGIFFDPQLLNRNFYTTSSCGVCGKSSLEALKIRGCPVIAKNSMIISEKTIYALSEKLIKTQSLFEQTGGLHAAALFDVKGRLISLKEDVGRHNAVDKLIGQQFLRNQLPLAQYLMMVSGRASFEIMQKALMAGIPIVVAVGAPSTLAIQLANDFGMTLVGFARKERFNVYSNPYRIEENIGALKGAL